MQKLISTIILFYMFSYTTIQADSTISNIWNSFTQKEYNILLAPSAIRTVEGKQRKSINKVYKKVLKELVRQDKMKNIELNLKVFSAKRGGGLEQFKDADIKSYYILKNMLERQVYLYTGEDIPSEIKDEDSFDFDFSLIDEPSVKKTIPKQTEIFSSSFMELSELYNQEVIELNNAKHPFRVKGDPVMKRVDAILGLYFHAINDKEVQVTIVFNDIDKNSGDVRSIIKRITPIDITTSDFKIVSAINKILHFIRENE